MKWTILSHLVLNIIMRGYGTQIFCGGEKLCGGKVDRYMISPMKTEFHDLLQGFLFAGLLPSRMIYSMLEVFLETKIGQITV